MGFEVVKARKWARGDFLKEEKPQEFWLRGDLILTKSFSAGEHLGGGGGENFCVCVGVNKRESDGVV